MRTTYVAAVITFFLAMLYFTFCVESCKREPTPEETIRGAEILLKLARHYTSIDGGNDEP